MTWQVEMLWRCTSCKHQNRGRELACVGCGSPKDGSEEYEMPADVSTGAAVHDASLLSLARGGANWVCPYCGTDQRRKDGACVCCGGGRVDSAADRPPDDAPPDDAPPDDAPRVLVSRWWWQHRITIAGVVFAFGLVALAYVVHRRNRWAAPVDAVVSALRWEHRRTLHQRMLVDGGGFSEQKPAGALEIRELGERWHHDEQVKIGATAQLYDDKELDGTTTESYTAQEACGQTCTSSTKTCRNVCKSNKNGFASCNEVCTGGGQTCSTKYCSVTKTKSVPRYKKVTKTRYVPIFEKQPRYAMWFAWRVWQWVPVERRVVSGTDNSPRTLPAAAFDAGIAEVGPGSDTQVTEGSTYTAELRWVDGELARSCEVELPLDIFRRIATGMKVKITTAPCRIYNQPLDARPYTAPTSDGVETLAHPQAPKTPDAPPTISSTSDAGRGDARGD